MENVEEQNNIDDQQDIISSSKEKRERKIAINNMIIAFCAMVGIILLIAICGFFILQPDEEILMGQAEAVEIRISGKVPGRIVKFYFEEGDKVHKGDTLVLIPSPEVAAKLEQANAMHEAFDTQKARTESNNKAQQTAQSAYDVWQKAIINRKMAENNYKRMNTLKDQGVVSAQRLEEAETAYKSTQASERVAKNQYEMAKETANQDNSTLMKAMLNYSIGTLHEVYAYENEGALISPIDGEISEIFPKEGELVGTGAPIMNIVDLNRMTVSFNVREDMLSLFTVGTIFHAFVPALDNKEVILQVAKLKDMGSYAVWKATKTNGQYDVKTFEVIARPTEKINGLHPGMSVIYQHKSKPKTIKLTVE